LQKITVEVIDAAPIFKIIMLKTLKNRMKLLHEFLLFLKTSKRWWLIPILLFLILLSLLIILTESSALAPFIYTLF